MSLISRIVGWMAKLPSAVTYDLTVARDIAVPAPDGVSLLMDMYVPRGRDNLPTVLTRSPYGRASLFGLLFGRLVAERGFRAIVQSCRGTFGSGGTFTPFRHEKEDGLATVAWIKQQPWFNGQLATIGASYLGFAQWAIARHTGPEHKVMSTWIASAEYRSTFYPGQAFWLESALAWTVATYLQEKRSPFNLRDLLSRRDQNEPGYYTLPVTDAPKTVLGHDSHFWQEWVEHEAPDDPWWEATDFRADVPHITVPNLMLSGWYDIALPKTLREYGLLREAGQQPYLTIGPWAHTDPAVMPTALRETLPWLRAHLYGDKSGLREAPVRIFVMGAEAWRELPDWPVAGTRPQRWHLHPHGQLATGVPPISNPDHYQYDPHNPTPNIGGATMGRVTGGQDNRALEARPDVLVYSSEQLDKDTEYIGPVTVELYVQSSRSHTDFFARLCDVDPTGKSTNITDQIYRVAPGRPTLEADGCLKLLFDLWPMAYRFKKGHRLRLQISSGAFPRYARNPGTGEPTATAQTLHPADQTVFHDPEHPSAIILCRVG